MSVLKLSKKDIIRNEDEEDKIKLDRSQVSYDSGQVSTWEAQNKESTSTLKRYGDMISSGGFLTAADLTSYRKALDDYISSATGLRHISKVFGDNTEGDDDKKWQDSLASLESDYKIVFDYYSKYKTEDDYIKSAPEASGDRQKRYDDNKKRIEELKADLKKVSSAQASNNSAYSFGDTSMGFFLPASDPSYNTRIKDINAEIESLEAENRMYERGEGGYISKLVDDHNKVTTNADFAVGSAKRDYNNASREALWDYDAATIEGSEALSNQGYFDEDGNIRDYYGNIVQPANAPIVEDKLGMFLSAGEEEVTEAYNRLSATNGNYTDTWANLIQEGDQGSWRYLTEPELGIYYYYLDESQEKAYKYLSDMKTELNRRQTLDESGQWYDTYDKANLLKKIAMNAATVPAQLVGGVAGFVEDTANTIMGNEVNPYSAAHGGMHFSQTIRGATAEDLDATGITIPVLDFSLGDMYQTGMSILDSYAAIGIGGNLGGALLAMNATTNEATRLYQQGASMEQIAIGSAAAGAAEMVFESLSIDKLINMKDAKTISQLIKNVLIQGGVEASEEGFTEIANILTNAVVMTGRSDWAKLVEENGGSEWKAFLAEVQSVAQATFGGFLSGMGSASVPSTISYGATQSQYAKTGKTIQGVDGGVDALMALANEVAGVSTGKTQESLNKQTASVGKNVTNRRVGKLFDSVSTATNLANASDIAKSLQRKGFSAEKANTIAEAMVAQASGQQLTNKQAQALNTYKDDGRVRNAEKTIIANEMSTMSQRSQNIRDFELDIAIGMLAKEYEEKAADAVKKQYTEKEFTPEGKFDVAADNVDTKGKAIDKDGNTFDIKGVHSIHIDPNTKKPVMLLKTGDGKTVNASEVSYSSKNDALIYEAVANLGDRVNADTANKLIAQYKGGDAMVFARGIAQAYTYGYYGIAKSELKSKDTLAAMLTTAQVNAAYTLGKQYRPQKDLADKANAKLKKAPGEKGVYYRDKNGNAVDIRTHLENAPIELKDVQSTAIEVMEKLSEVMGVRFNVFESWIENGKRYYLNEDGAKTEGNPNGFYDPRTGEIYIDLNAGNDYQGTMLFTVAHELTHFMRQWSPEQFTKIAKIVFQHGDMKGSVTELVALKQAKRKASGKSISYDTAMEELVADGMETILKNGKVVEFMADVKQKDLNAWEKLKEWFKNLAEVLKEMVTAYSSHSAQTTEGERVAAFSKKLLGQIEQIYSEGAIAAGENYQAAVNRAKSIVGQITDSLDDIMALDTVYTIDSSNATPYTGIRKDDEICGKNVFKEQGGVAVRPGLGKVVLGRKGAVNTVFHGNGPAKQAAFPAIKAVIEQGIEIFQDINHKGRGYDTITYAAPVDFFKAKSPLGVVVQVFDNGRGDKSFYIHEICDAEGNYIELVDGVPTKKEISNTGEVEPTSTADVADDGIAPKDNIHNDSKIVKNESAEAMDVEVDEKTESVAPTVLKSERTWTESDYVQEREKAAKEIAQAIGVSVKKAKAYIDSVNSIAKMIADDRVRLDYFSSPGRSSFVGNVEYGGSFDFSTLCKKRRLLTGTFTAIQKALPNTALTADEILDIRNRMKEKGIEVSCGLCYVEGSRANMGQFAKEFLNLYKQYYPDAWQPNMADVNTPDGIEWVRINHPECYEQYEYFWNHYGTLKEGDKNLFASQQKPKLYQLHTEYKGEILQKFNDDDNVEEKNLNGGIRLQSFSDFEIVHLIDTMQIIMDMARVGLAGQAYTKVPDFAWALGDTGLKINLSLIAKGVDENGKLIFDDVEGMPIDTAVELRNRYSKNVGTILVPFNDEQLLAAMADERVDYIIPFHRSQWTKTQYEAMGLPAKVKDYTYMQNEKFIKPQYHEYRGRMVKDKATNYMPNEYWDFSKSGKENAEAYLEMCARNNKRPKFYKLLQNNGDGSYSLKADGSTDGYWKLLIDFKMYDNEGNGSPQLPVTPDFNMDEATRMLNEYSGGHSNFPVAQGVVDSFVQEYKDSHKGAMFSDRDTESVSNRSLLANAFEGIITNPIEKQKIQEYKGQVAMLDAEEKKLRELNEQIKELSFAKGPRDTKKIRDLRFDAQQTANRIATLDKTLLRLEAATPLQNILQREKDMVRKRERQKSREALAEQRAEFEAKQKETIDKWRDSRKTAVAKARETAEKRDARAKLQKLVLDTAKWISYPAKTDVKCPDILKQPYADFLNGIDLSSKRLANGGDPTNNDLRLANAMGSLATALDKIMTSQDPTQETDKVMDTGYLDLPADFVQKIRDMTENIKAMMVEGEYVVNTMSAAEVRQLSQMIRTLNHAIKTMSTLYANLRFANIEALGFDTMEFMDALGEIEKTGGMKDFVQWDNALPYYAFKRFGKGGESVFEGLMDAQDKLAFLAQKIFDFQEKAWTGKEAKAWSEDTHTITLPNGNELTLTTADAMSIYCLSRREQGLQHLLGGGTRVMGIQKGSKKAKDSRSVLTMEDISAITSTLTDRQRAVAEAIQEFMSTVCSEWGNEISMKRFLTKEFNEKFYFPIESNDENLPTKDPAAQQSDLFRLLNISATKPLTPGANNEVIIRNIFDVFTGHASDMARLNSYGMALLDYMKWLNYREKTSNEEGQIKVRGVRKSMEQAYGNAAKSYVLNLIKDVNGRPSDGGDPNILMKWMRNAKTASVGNSLRVATLQLTSYPRAALVLSPKNLALGITKVPKIETAKKYCGIALWKSFGFYDTNISRSIEDQMKGVKDVKQKLIELSLKGAEWGDAITWGALWNACEYEVAQNTKNKVGSEEFYQEVGKKLREVVYRTQVVDSTLTRSQIMRSKRGMAQEAAAFMSEPTLSANILMDAGFEFNAEKRRTGSAKAAWTKTAPYIGRALAVYSIGQLTAALLEGLWDAWRDDEDEEFREKYLAAFGENLVLDLVPFNKIPIVSDVFEAVLAMVGVGFYSSDKMSTTWLTQAVSAMDTWKKVLSGGSSTTVYNALYKSVRAISSFYGVSVSGVMREGVALWNNTAGAYDTTLKIRQYELSSGDLGRELYEAIISGNDRQAESLHEEFREKSDDDKDYQSAVTSAIRKALRENDPRIREAAESVVNGNPSKRANIVREIFAEGHFSMKDIQAAINAEVDKLRKDAKDK